VSAAWRIKNGGLEPRVGQEQTCKLRFPMNFDLLLNPVDSANPCGPNLEDDFRYQELYRVVEENQRAIEHPGDGNEPDWRKQRQLASDLLGKSKDARIAVYLAQSALRIDGLDGFAAGVSLLESLLKNYWDGLHPRLDLYEDLDPDFRLNALQELGSPLGTLHGLDRAPLLSGPATGPISLRDVKFSRGQLTPEAGKSVLASGVVGGVLQRMKPDDLGRRITNVGAMIESVEHIEAQVKSNIASAANWHLAPVIERLREIHRVLSSGANQSETNQSSGLGATAQPSATPTYASHSIATTHETVAMSSHEIRTRADVIESLDRICSYYASSEPSSPVPLLLLRAKKLVDKNFMQILRELAPDAVEQAKNATGRPEEESAG